jgi:hypothetical protein
VLWLVTASIGDVPIAIIACLALVLGVVLAARGRRGEPAVVRAESAEESPPAMLSVPPASAATPAAPAVGHGPIRFVTHDDEPSSPSPEPVRLAPRREPAPVTPPAAPAPPATEREPAQEPAPPQEPTPAQEPSPPPSPQQPAAPQTPPTTFRQGAIKIGGLDRRRD